MIYLSVCSILGHNPEKVEYLDLQLNGDTEKYVDPNMIEYLADRSKGDLQVLSKQANTQIYSFFNQIIKILKSDENEQKKRIEMNNLFSFFQEPQHLNLGISLEGNTGKGTTAEELVKTFMREDVVSLILDESGLTIPQKTPLFPYFADDKLSDLTSNIIMNVIIEFNKKIVVLYPEMSSYLSSVNEEYNYYSNGTWKQMRHKPFIFSEKKVLFIPKDFATYKQTSSLSLLIRTILVEAIEKDKIKNNREKRKTKKEFEKENIAGNRTENTRKIYDESTEVSYKYYQKEVINKVKERLTED